MTISDGSLSKAICDRCRSKVDYRELRPDGNVAKLMVCRECWDGKDPYRLPARKPDNFTLAWSRPDERLITSDDFLLTEDGITYILTEDGEQLEV